MDNTDRNADDLQRNDPAVNRDATTRRATDDASLRDRLDEGNPTLGNEIGEAAGGISGVLAGAAIGSVGGPVGTLIGAIAGAVGGWWAGRAVSEAASRVTNHDEDYRTHFESTPDRPADRSYDDVRPAYHLGHLAAHNPEYQGRDWDDIEPELQRGWTDDVRTRHGDWDTARSFAREGYTRGRSSGFGASGATTSNSVSEDLRTAGTTGAGIGAGGGSTLDDTVDVGRSGGVGSGLGSTDVGSGVNTGVGGTMMSGTGMSGMPSSGSGLFGTGAMDVGATGLGRGLGATSDALGAADAVTAREDAGTPSPFAGSGSGSASTSAGTGASGTSGFGSGLTDDRDSTLPIEDHRTIGAASMEGVSTRGDRDVGLGVDRNADLGAHSGVDSNREARDSAHEVGRDPLNRAGMGDRLVQGADDFTDRIDGNPASRPGLDATDTRRDLSNAGGGIRHDVGSAVEGTGDRAEGAWERTKEGVKNFGERVADKADDLKDRVDGNPSSRPGIDRTDDVDRRF